MTMVSTSSARTVWAGLATLARLTRTLPSCTSCAASVRDLTMRANHSHLSSRCTATVAGAGECPRALVKGGLVLAALLHLRLEQAQRSKRRIGIERRLGCRRGGLHVQAWPLLTVAGAAAAPIGTLAARRARLHARFELARRRLVGSPRALLPAPVRLALERPTLAPGPPHFLPRRRRALPGARGRRCRHCGCGGGRGFGNRHAPLERALDRLRARCLWRRAGVRLGRQG